MFSLQRSILSKIVFIFHFSFFHCSVCPLITPLVSSVTLWYLPTFLTITLVFVFNCGLKLYQTHKTRSIAVSVLDEIPSMLVVLKAQYFSFILVVILVLEYLQKITDKRLSHKL